jgi:hypothetical protein
MAIDKMSVLTSTVAVGAGVERGLVRSASSLHWRRGVALTGGNEGLLWLAEYVARSKRPFLPAGAPAAHRVRS